MADGTMTFYNRNIDPVAPAAGKVKFYAKSNNLYQIDETGLVSTLSGTAAHKTSHNKGGSDALEVISLGTSNNNTALRLAPDGAGGVIWGTVSAYDMRDALIFDHFITSNLANNTLGKHNWSVLVSGTGADLLATGEAGHPGIIDFGCGTSSSGRSAIFLGGTSGLTSFLLSTNQNPIDSEWLVRFNAGALLSTSLNRWFMGFGDIFDAASGVELTNGIYIELNPSTSANFVLRTANASIRSSASTSITALANTWYRVGIRVFYPSGVPTAELYINGVLRATLTTNIPSSSLGIGVRGDPVNTAVEARYQVDYCQVSQVTSKET